MDHFFRTWAWITIDKNKPRAEVFGFKWNTNKLCDYHSNNMKTKFKHDAAYLYYIKLEKWPTDTNILVQLSLVAKHCKIPFYSWFEPPANFQKRLPNKGKQVNTNIKLLKVHSIRHLKPVVTAGWISATL